MSGTEIYQTFGKYQLTERLAFGGMAEVFLGTVHGEAGFVKPVVIKRLHPRLNEDNEFVQMLIDEARITAQLHHTNICQVLDLGSVDGSYYIAMEFISGEDLRTLQDQCRRHRVELPLSAIVYIVGELLAGLDYAHRKRGLDGEPLGIIHRDISPQNILISYEGEVKIIDFGIAKASARLVQTEAGVIKGKFRYMSPEQASGHPIDHRTDIFAAGVVLYELLRGGPHAMDLPDTEVLRRMRRAEFEPLHQFRSDIPQSLQRVLRQALDVKASRRHATAADFRQALLQVQQQELGPPFGRSDMSMLVQQLFDEERRNRHRSCLARSGEHVSRDPHSPTAYNEQAGTSASSTSAKDTGGLAYAATTAVDSDGGYAIWPDQPSEDPLESRPTTELNKDYRERSHPSPAGPLEDITTQAYKGPRGGRAEAEEDPDITGRVTAKRVRPPRGPSPPAEQVAPRESGQRDRGKAKWTRARFHGEAAGSSRLSARLSAQPAEGVHPAEGVQQEEMALTSPLDVKPTSAQQFFLQQERSSQQTPRIDAHGESRSRSVFRTLVGLALVLLLGGAVAVTLYLLDVQTPSEKSEKSEKDAVQAVRQQRRVGWINVQSQPSGARIVLCGRATGRVTPARLQMQSGRPCTLELELSGYETYQFPVKLRQGKSMNVVAKLRPKLRSKRRPKRGDQQRGDPQRGDQQRGDQQRGDPQRGDQPQIAEGQGSLRVTAIQVGTVYINDRPAGHTPRLDLSLSPGMYRVRIFFDKLQQYSAERNVTIVEGRTTKIHLEPAR